MADKKNQEVPQEENLSQLLQIRRDKLKELQESGNDTLPMPRLDMSRPATDTACPSRASKFALMLALSLSISYRVIWKGSFPLS